MKIYYNFLIFFISFIFSSVLANDIVKKPLALFNSLHSNEGWEILDSYDNISISTKKIESKNLLAVMVKEELCLPKKILQNVIMDIDNYGEFLHDAGPFISRKVRNAELFVDGYQFIPISLPFFDNREYLFRMYPSGYKKNDNTSIIHWFLLDKDVDLLDRDTQTATYLNYGAGLWVAEEKNNSKILFSYRIYMDPGGSLPDFLIDMINKTSVVNIFNGAVAEAKKRYANSN